MKHKKPKTVIYKSEHERIVKSLEAEVAELKQSLSDAILGMETHECDLSHRVKQDATIERLKAEVAELNKGVAEHIEGVKAMLIAAGAPEDVDEMEREVLSIGTKGSDYIRHVLAAKDATIAELKASLAKLVVKERKRAEEEHAYVKRATELRDERDAALYQRLSCLRDEARKEVEHWKKKFDDLECVPHVTPGRVIRERDRYKAAFEELEAEVRRAREKSKRR